LQNSPLESSCVIVALIGNYSTSKPLKVCPEKSQILSSDTVVANEQNIVGGKNVNKSCNEQVLILKCVKRIFVFYLRVLVILITRILFVFKISLTLMNLKTAFCKMLSDVNKNCHLSCIFSSSRGFVKPS